MSNYEIKWLRKLCLLHLISFSSSQTEINICVSWKVSSLVHVIFSSWNAFSTSFALFLIVRLPSQVLLGEEEPPTYSPSASASASFRGRGFCGLLSDLCRALLIELLPILFLLD